MYSFVLNTLKFLWESAWWTIKTFVATLILVLLVGFLWYQYAIRQPPPSPLPIINTENSATPNTETLSVDTVSALIKQAEPINDPEAWAIDLRRALEDNQFARDRENVCAMIAVIDQESSFKDDQAINGKASLAAFEKKIAHLTPSKWLNDYFHDWFKTHPDPSNHYFNQIGQIQNERELDMIYRNIIQRLTHDYATTLNDRLAFYMPELLRTAPTVVRNLIEDHNEMNTVGSMQVAVNFAILEMEQVSGRSLNLGEVWALRDRMYTRSGGMYYGARQLLGYKTGYNQKIYRFADFNAGRYASRNAALQSIINTLQRDSTSLALDGDLLSYNEQKEPLTQVTNSEQAIRAVVANYQLGLSDDEIRRDLLLEKKLDFDQSATFKKIRQQYERSTKQTAPYAILPTISINSEKITGYSTARYAKKVNERYQACMRY